LRTSPQHWRPPPVNSFEHLRQVVTFVMPLKKASGLGAALQALDINQETLREARSQKMKATSPTPQEEELDQEIRDLEAIHQQVHRKKKMLRLSNLQKKIDEANEEMRHLTQDDQDQRSQRRELHQNNSYEDDEWYDDFHHENFAFDDASPLSAELQATPCPHYTSHPSSPCMRGTQIRSNF
jgi:TolA-binding protein